MTSEQTERLERLRASVNDAAKHVSGLYTTFLLVGVYIAITIGSTTDEQLLRESGLSLPILNVSLPIKAFYIIVPFAFVLLHLNLLLQVFLLTQKLVNFDEALQAKGITDHERQEQRGLVFPFTISTIFAQTQESRLVRSLLKTIMSTTLVVGPIALLLGAQMRFLPYHSVPITYGNRSAVLLDLLLIWLLWRLILESRGSVPGTSSETRPKMGRRVVSLMARAMPSLASLLTLVLCLSIATVPGEFIDRFGLHAIGYLHRYLDLSGKTLVAEPPPSEIIAAYIQKGKTAEQAWIDHAKKLDLHGRDLRGADFAGSRFFGADLHEAQLQGAILQSAQLQGADLKEAILNLCDLRGVNANSLKQQEAIELRAMLKRDVPSGDRMKQILARIPEDGVVTQFNLHPQIQNTLYDDKERTDTMKQWPRPTLSEKKYRALLVPYLVELANSDAWVAKGLANGRAGREPDLAKALLRAEREGKCPGLKDIPAEDRKWLEKAATR